MATYPTPLHALNKNPHFKIVFLAEGFSFLEQASFNNKASIAMGHILALEPFASNTTKINFYRINVNSAQIGISTIDHPYNPITPVTKNTPWGVHKNKVGLIRYLDMSSTKRTSLNTQYNGWFSDTGKIFFVIICNSNDWEGGAELPSFSQYSNSSVCIISKGRPTTEAADFKFLLTHEFGHSFGDLDDEYVDDCGDATGETPTCGTPATNNTAYAIKQYENDVWNHPNRLNTKDTNPGGWIQGSRWISTGKWRSSNNCLMRTGSVFSATNEALIQDRIDAEAISYLIGFTIKIGSAKGSANGTCNNTPSVSKYYEQYELLAIGTCIYDDIHLQTPFDGNNKWYKTNSSDISMKISSTGEILEYYTC